MPERKHVCDECGVVFQSTVWRIYHDWIMITTLSFCSEWCRDEYYKNNPEEVNDLAHSPEALLSREAMIDAAREAILLDGDYVEYD